MEQPGQSDSSIGSARLRVLEMIDEGTITAAEGLRLLEAFSAADETAEAADKVEFLSRPTGSTGPAGQPAVDEEIPLPDGVPAPPQPAVNEITGFTAGQPGPTETATSDSAADDPAADYSAADYSAADYSAAVLPAAQQPQVLPPPVSQTTTEPRPAAALPADAQKWKRWWMLPVWIGVGITVFGGLFMYLAMRSSGIGFWFVCASTPFILGVLVIAAAWGSRNAPWLHLRIRQAPGEKPEKIAFSMPLPIRPAAWFLRTFGRWIPGLQEQSFDELILAVGDKTSPDNPLYIVVDEEETGEKVEIYIG